MPARSRGNRDHAIRALIDDLFGVVERGDVAENLAARLVHPLDGLGRAAEGGDDERDFFLGADLEVGLSPEVRLVDDQVDGERPALRLGFDLADGLAEFLGRSPVQRGRAPEGARAADRGDELHAADQEHGSGDDGVVEAQEFREFRRKRRGVDRHKFAIILTYAEYLDMPLYEYGCSSCGKVHEVMQKFSDAPLSACPECQGPVEKLVSLSSFALKGSGWYTTDYKRAAKAPESKPAAESKPATESKPAANP